MKTFITAISMQGTLKQGVYEPVNFTLADNRKTAFPIIPVIADHLACADEDEKDYYQIIAIVVKNADTDRNYQLFLAELEELGVPESKVKKIEVEENPSEIMGLKVILRILEHVPESGDVYACITYGTKVISTMITFSLMFLEKLKVNCVVEGMYYGELVRENNEEIGRRLHNLVNYLLLGNIVDHIKEMKVTDADEFFRDVLGVE